VKFPTPSQQFDISKFGGWSPVNDKFFDPEKGIVAKIFQSQGKSTASG
jgi:ABC-type sulfate transport system substrate-binding protein